MTRFESNEARHANGEYNHDQARLLRGEGEVFNRSARTAREPRVGRCVLTQPRAQIPDAAPASRTESVYETGARITCIDRTIIRAYFHPYDASGPARRKKLEGCSRSRAGQRYCDASLLPADLERSLTSLPAGYYRMLRGNSVFLVEERTHKIVDAVRGV